MKRVQNPQVCHGHSRPIVELAYRWVPQVLRRPMVNMKVGMLICNSRYETFLILSFMSVTLVYF